MSIWQWEHIAEGVPEPARVTLGEGGTPLVRSRAIGPKANFADLRFKLEQNNPSGSYKDRFAASAISHMVTNRQHTCVATSSGNTGAALAAYCAAAKIKCRIAVVEGAPASKLQQMLAYGAEVFRVKGFGLDPVVTEQTFERLQLLGKADGHALQISAFAYSPLGMTGVGSMAMELADQCADVSHVFSPAGGGGLTVAVARGFSRGNSRPAVHCVQPDGNDTISSPLRDGSDNAHDVDCTSQISGLQVASVIDGNEVIRECRASGGTGHLVSDEEVWATQKRLAEEEGIFCEPAGAVSVAGALASLERGDIAGQGTVVCLITGSGFKDQASVERMNSARDCPTIEWRDIS
ncbi:MAG: threonine synthase [Verrucomicrobiales bacterium]|nr:threonine synthase [Verrucomicrobiales bacterium]|tara:strand:- start:14413 stop:15462 length:1050 start_codon:yes stop_codon:yes gene_type:complete